MRRTIAALSVLALFAAPATAQDSKLELTTTVDRADVKVGGRFTVTVRLKNNGAEAVELPKLEEDRQLISFDVKLDDGKEFTYEKITPSPYTLKADWPVAKLEPGETWQLQTDFTGLVVGTFTVRAHYSRWRPQFDKILAEAEEKLKADPDSAVLKSKLAGIKKQRGLETAPAHLESKTASVNVTAGSGGEEELTVRMLTSMGPVRLKLFAREALGTCLHFARLIRDGGLVGGKQQAPYYRGLTFHRVIQGFMLQGGCPQGNGLGGPGYAIPSERPAKDSGPEKDAVKDMLKHTPGRLSMARSGHYDSAGSQFFICVGETQELDGEYTVFGEVSRGMDVVYTISEVNTGAQDKPIDDVTIETIELLPRAGS